MIIAREHVADETALNGHAANGKRRASGAARKGSGVNCDSRLPRGESKPQLTPDPVGPAPAPGCSRLVTRRRPIPCRT